MFSERSEVGIETFELQSSLWKLITDMCPSNEAEEIKRILGASLVEQACDLYEEASTLLDIWRIAREDTDTELNERHHSSSRLPEPPNMRERLLQEIHFFIDYLKEKNEKQRSSKSVPSYRSNSSEHVLEYVTKTRVKRGMEGSGGCGTSRGSSGSAGSSRPMSGVSSRDGRETPLRVVTPGSQSDEGSQLSVLSDRVESIDEQVNATDIDQVVEHLRHVLSEECDQRRDDIHFLQKSLDEEQEFRTSVNKPEPTLQELREFSSQLEKEILEGSTSPPPSLTSPAHPKPPLLPAIPHPPSTQSSRQRSFNRASKVKRSSVPTHPHGQPNSESTHQSSNKVHTSTASLSGHNNVVALGNQTKDVTCQDRITYPTCTSSLESRQQVTTTQFSPVTRVSNSPNSLCTRTNTHDEYQTSCRGSSPLVDDSLDQESDTVYNRSGKSRPRGAQSTCIHTSPSCYG